MDNSFRMRAASALIAPILSPKICWASVGEHDGSRFGLFELNRHYCQHTHTYVAIVKIYSKECELMAFGIEAVAGAVDRAEEVEIKQGSYKVD